MRRAMNLMLVISLLLWGLSVIPDESWGAEVDLQLQHKVRFESTPLSVAASADGKTVAVLTAKGEVEIFSHTGDRKAVIKVSPRSSGLAMSSGGRKLFVIDSEGKNLQMLTLEYILNLKTTNRPFRGPENAQVVIVEFADHECPFCARVEPLLEQILDKYPDQVKLVYKFLPLTSIHKRAMKAAEAALAAERQGKFWEYSKELLKIHDSLSENNLVATAEKIGLDIERFARDRKDPRLVKIIREDMQEAKKNQIHSIPSFFVNGRRLKRYSPEGFEAAVQDALKK